MGVVVLLVLLGAFNHGSICFFFGYKSARFHEFPAFFGGQSMQSAQTDEVRPRTPAISTTTQCQRRTYLVVFQDLFDFFLGWFSHKK